MSKPLIEKITEWDAYTGRFQASEEVSLQARVSGYLDAVLFDDGQRVKKGDILFRIDPRPFQIELDRATAEFVLSKKELKRGEELRNSRAIAQEDLDRRIQQYSVSKAAYDQAKLNMEFTEVVTPIDGRVSRNYADVGNLITGGASNATLLTTIVKVSPIHFYFDAGEQAFLKYIRLDKAGEREGSRTVRNPAYVKLQDESEFVHPGYIDFVDNQIDKNTGTIAGRLIFDNTDEVMQPGMFGRAQLRGRVEFSAMMVPEVIISSDQSSKFVYVVGAENTIERRTVNIGRLYNNKFRIIESGLNKDDLVVAKNIQRLRSGTVVAPTVEEFQFERVEERIGGAKPLENRKNEAGDKAPNLMENKSVSDTGAETEAGAEANH